MSKFLTPRGLGGTLIWSSLSVEYPAAILRDGLLGQVWNELSPPLDRYSCQVPEKNKGGGRAVWHYERHMMTSSQYYHGVSYSSVAIIEHPAFRIAEPLSANGTFRSSFPVSPFLGISGAWGCSVDL